MAKIEVDVVESEMQETVEELASTYGVEIELDNETSPHGIAWMTVTGDREKIVAWLQGWYMPGCDTSFEESTIEE